MKIILGKKPEAKTKPRAGEIWRGKISGILYLMTGIDHGLRIKYSKDDEVSSLIYCIDLDIRRLEKVSDYCEISFGE